uniref:Protein kinase domain-containing protein n=1 Tax=Brassica oleracea TaxID=3712 RepID=A0A3P6E1M7_BRAOL|nr:unnamed protein product [Brassica oleracea]
MKTTKSTDYPQQMGNGLKSCKQKHTSPLINTPLLEEEEVENLRIFSVEELKKLPVSVMEGLVYSQKSLQDWKISKVCPFSFIPEEEALPWGTRVKIATGIAQGVAFIHSIKNSPLHQELRMHNILLDEQYNAKLLYLDSKNQSWPEDWTFAGTIYKSPENMFADILGMETDVYIFGVILLELFTGSKEILIKLNRLRTSSFLFTELIDPRLGSDYPVNAATTMGTLIRICTVVDRKKRPLMQQVADVLNSVMCRGT